MGLGLIGEALLGAVGGAGKAMAETATEEIKQKAMEQREKILSQIRRGDHAANKMFDLKAADEQAARERERVAGVMGKADEAAKGKALGLITDTMGMTGEDSGVVLKPGDVQPTREQSAVGLVNAGIKSGDLPVVKEGRAELEAVRKEKTEERRAANEQRRLDQTDQKMDDANRKSDRQFDLLVAKAGKKDSDEKDTAEMKNITFLADTLFGRKDAEKRGDAAGVADAMREAARFKYGTQDKPRSERVLALADKLRDDPDSAVLTAEKRLEKAGKIIDKLREMDTPSRGGVKPDSAKKPDDKPKDAKAAPASTTYTGMNTKSGKRIMRDASGKKFVEE